MEQLQGVLIEIRLFLFRALRACPGQTSLAELVKAFGLLVVIAKTFPQRGQVFRYFPASNTLTDDFTGVAPRRNTCKVNLATRSSANSRRKPFQSSK